MFALQHEIYPSQNTCPLIVALLSMHERVPLHTKADLFGTYEYTMSVFLHDLYPRQQIGPMDVAKVIL